MVKFYEVFRGRSSYFDTFQLPSNHIYFLHWLLDFTTVMWFARDPGYPREQWPARVTRSRWPKRRERGIWKERRIWRERAVRKKRRAWRKRRAWGERVRLHRSCEVQLETMCLEQDRT